METKPNIHIFKDGSKLGPYSKTVIKESLRLGTVPENTPAWTSDNPKWRSIASLIQELEHQESQLVAADQIVANTTRGGESNADALAEPEAQAKQNDRAVYKMIVGASAAIAVILFFALVNNDENGAQGGLLETFTNHGGNDSLPRGMSSGVNVAGSLQEAEKCVLMAKTNRARGTAFIAATDGEVYIYTNVHVAAADGLRFTDFNGNSVSHNPLGEVVEWDASEQIGVDLVRFPLISKVDHVLSFEKREEIELRSNVWALGDSGGENILKSLPGKITGIGPDKIEVDCEFVSGNSGGPIVAADGKVVGIASYMKLDRSPWAKGTEQEVRRIAWMLHDGYGWTRTTSDDLAAEAGMIENCIHASLILMAVMELNASPDGFVLGDDLSDFSNDIILETADHPLNKGILETSNVVADNTARGVGDIQNFREYIQFYESCRDYHKSALEEAHKNVRSSHFCKMIDPYMDNHRKLLESFESKLQAYRTSSSPYGALEDR